MASWWHIGLAFRRRSRPTQYAHCHSREVQEGDRPCLRVVLSVHPLPDIIWIGCVGFGITQSIWENILDVGRYLERTRYYNPFRPRTWRWRDLVVAGEVPTPPTETDLAVAPALGQERSGNASCQTFIRMVEWLFPDLRWHKLDLDSIMWEKKIYPPHAQAVALRKQTELFENHGATMHDSLPYDDSATVSIMALVADLLGTNLDDEEGREIM